MGFSEIFENPFGNLLKVNPRARLRVSNKAATLIQQSGKRLEVNRVIINIVAAC